MQDMISCLLDNKRERLGAAVLYHLFFFFHQVQQRDICTGRTPVTKKKIKKKTSPLIRYIYTYLCSHDCVFFPFQLPTNIIAFIYLQVHTHTFPVPCDKKKLGKRFYREIKWKATNTAHLPHQHSVTSISKDQVLSTSVHHLFCLYLFLSSSYISFICLFHWLPSPPAHIELLSDAGTSLVSCCWLSGKKTKTKTFLYLQDEASL